MKGVWHRTDTLKEKIQEDWGKMSLKVEVEST